MELAAAAHRVFSQVSSVGALHYCLFESACVFVCMCAWGCGLAHVCVACVGAPALVRCDVLQEASAAAAADERSCSGLHGMSLPI